MGFSVNKFGYSFKPDPPAKVGPEVNDTMGAPADADSSLRAHYIAIEVLKLLETNVYPTNDQPQIEVEEEETFLEDGQNEGFLYITKILDVPDQNNNFDREVIINILKKENGQRQITVSLSLSYDFFRSSDVDFLTDYDNESDTYTYLEGTANFNSDEDLQNIEHFFRYQKPN